ncbi:MAG: glycoside hydrolase family 3 protein [Acidobacteria bacterium]|nr:glycoside hydrolase family 3 protein [Acidobacteriota bacterium]
MKELIKIAGQMLCIGFEGLECGPELRSLLTEVRPGGVIFFQRNIATVEQFRTLVADIRKVLAESRPFLAIDQEGGEADRFRELLGPLPSARDAAQAGLAFELGDLAGRELAVFGLKVDFAPVLDLLAPESQTILGTRSAGNSAEEVIRFAEPFLEGLVAQNVLGCGKHFPGLGGGNKDSHSGMPTIEKTEMALWKEDLLPFRNLADRLPMIMVAHAAYPALERTLAPGRPLLGGTLPASLSPNIISGLLRERIGYEGLVVCDDLEMGGALEGRTIEEAAIAAVLAGCDMLLVCRSAEKVERVFGSLLREAGNHVNFRGQLTYAAQRILHAKERARITELPAPEPLGDWHTLREQIRRMNAAVSLGLRQQRDSPGEEAQGN